MNPQQDSPAFWRSLYEAPSESSMGPEAESGRVAFDAADLVAEISEAPTEQEGDAPTVDPAALEALVERLVAERLAAERPPPRRAEPDTRPMASAPPRARREPPPVPPTPAPSTRAAPAPGPIPPVTRAAGSGHDTPRPGSPAPSSRPSRPRPSASRDAPTTPRRMPMPAADADDPFATAISGEMPAAPAPEPVAAAPVEPEPVEPEPAVAPEPEPEPTPARAAPIDKTTGHWVKVPVLKGGPEALMTAGLDPAAGLVLSMIDGVSALKGIKALLPHVPDDTFLQIFRDALGKGLVEFK